MPLSDSILASVEKLQSQNEVSIEAYDATLTYTQIHCLAAIGDISDANVTKLAKTLNMTTGAITKMCKKLFTCEFVEKYQNESNSKEIYYKLTASGKNIYDVHHKIHEKSRSKKEAIISTFSKTEQITILQFLEQINQLHSDVPCNGRE